MSLLLDALKKAAEKKAQKSGQSIESDDTRVDTTRADATQADGNHTETQRLDTHQEQTRIDPTESYTETERLDTAHQEQSEIDPTEVDERPLASRQPSADAPASPPESAEARHQAADDITDEYADDPTMLVMDDSIPVDDEGHTLIETDEYTAEELARLRKASQPELTPDDVTEFLGDGGPSHGSDLDATSATRTVEMRPLTLDDIQVVDSAIGSDDTTMTNPEEPAAPPTGEDTTARSVPAGAQASRQVPPPRRSDSDQAATVINPESHGAAVDLDRLTHEQTVGTQTTTSSRSFAPDNYDRTLIKLSETDVSRIFPGMKAEPGAVMTPDYAKKVFMSKSQRYRGRYLKWMAGVGLTLLLAIGLWGMFDLNQETQRIDASLAQLKQDPMPGVIRPPQEEKIDLFAPATTIPQDLPTEPPAMAENPSADATPAAEQLARNTGDETPAPASPTEQVSPATPEPPAAAPRPSQASNRQPARASASAKTATAATKTIPAQATRKASLQLSSSERIDDKDRMLGEAFAAYERSDLSEARRLYAAVLELEPDNRDALLGMAAIEVQDGDYNRAIELYQKLLLLNPKDGDAMASLIAVANIDPQRGETRIKQMLSEKPDSPYLYFTLGNMYSRQQRWSEAQAAYFQALQLKPDDPNAAYNLAVSLEHLGKPGVARTYYQRALDNRDRTLATFDADQVAQRVEVLSQ